MASVSAGLESHLGLRQTHLTSMARAQAVQKPTRLGSRSRGEMKSDPTLMELFFSESHFCNVFFVDLYL